MIRYVLFAFCVAMVTSLRLEDAEEGSCRGFRFQPVPDGGVDFLKMVPTFRNIVAGSRYAMYQYASGHPGFAQMHENELRDNMCLTHNGIDASGRGVASGFGSTLGNYTFTPRRGRSLVFNFSFVPSNRGSSLIRSIHTITLTDYKTFVFFANCYTTVNSTQLKTWNVLSLTPTLSASTRRAIENHAASLGFNRKNFIFLNFDTCGAGGVKNLRGFNSRNQQDWRNNGQSGWSK